MATRTEHSVYEFERFRLDAASSMLYHKDQEVSLPPKAVETLLALVERSDEIVPKDELMEIIWSGSIVAESNLSQYLHLLRKTLGNRENGKPFIETLRRRGYRFNGEVAVSNSPYGNLLKIRKAAGYSGDFIPLSADAHANHNPRPLRVKRTDNIYSVADWRRGTENHVAELLNSAGKARRKPGRTFVIMAILVFGAAIVFGVYRFGGRWQKSGAAAIPFNEMNVARLTTSGKTKHAAISPDGNYIAHITRDADGYSLWVRQVAAPNDIRIAGPAAAEYVWLTFAPDGGSIYYLTLDRDKGDTGLFRVPVLGGPSSIEVRNTGPVGFSPAAARITYIREHNEVSNLYTANIDGTDERIVATRHDPDDFLSVWNAPAWSPDGKTIAAPVHVNDENGAYETVIGVGVDDGVQRPLTPMRWQNVGQPKWTGDGLLVTARERAAGPQQVWYITPQDGAAARVTHDLNYYYDLSLTADGSRMAVVQMSALSNVWIVRDGDNSRAKQIASETGWVEEIAWKPDGHILYRSNAGNGTEIWMMDADGAGSRQLTAGAGVGHGLAVTPDDRHIVFASDRGGRSNIWRVDADGTGFKQLTSGDGEFNPACTPDGQWVVYQSSDIEPRLWKVPIDGGAPIQLTTTRAVRPDVSPDGKLVAYHYLDPDFEESRWSIGVSSTTGGDRLARFDLPPTVSQRYVRWSPDGRSIAYANGTDNMSDLWLQPLSGGPPLRMTDFKSDPILVFDWSTDRRTLAIVRNIEVSDVVLIGPK